MTERPATSDPPALAGSAVADWPTVPGYEILAELGRGGMGVVYKARQQPSSRLVALKLIRDGALAGPQERARFQIEADAASRMQHPNIVEIYEIGAHQGLPYFAMELVEGGSLDRFLAGRPVSARDAAAVMRTLALAVQHAHEQKVVHRDLKPANVLLAWNRSQTEESGDSNTISDSCLLIPDPSTFCPKITDFGLAKRLDSDSTAWTQDGALVGTASYMAPEQAAGRVQETGPRVDVYALGVILYELLTGRPPFQGETLHHTVQQVLYSEPEPPSRFQPQVPLELETVCLKCLEKEPQRRYDSAGDLAADLGRFVAGESVVAMPPDKIERLKRLASRDGYEIREELGRGPRSTVYQAVYGPLKQPVAVKVFRPGVCTRDAWERTTAHSTETLSMLTHPNLLLMQRAGWWHDAPFVVTEYVPQGNLVAAIAGRPYSFRAALELVAELAEIVSYLHRQGVVHGNLKPANVLLAANGIPRLVDFRATGSLFLGSHPIDCDVNGPGYLPPEYLETPEFEPRPYTDIYGLGTILYELLTGRPPFAGSKSGDVLDQIRSQEPAPPSQFNDRVFPLLDTLCLKCLRKNPWKRYHRAYDLAARVRSLMVNPNDRGGRGEA